MSEDTMTPLRDAVRSFNRYALNPVMMCLAGRKHWYASVIRHTGRTSGKHYAKPVVAEQVSGGILIPLPYGTHVDWLRNVRAAGHATVTTAGETLEVTKPEVIDLSQARSELPPGRHWALQRIGVRKAVKLTLVQ
ncbi:deazaflavin-dependent oxidoreductase (nitroreductase family) [Mycobacterium frederiksbergense]|uniref:Deazaflavin-dependent oxidoreductase (Nitroreductase family) n=1 Tax=Mycolicibacterium frederiksbergense TaxID=117567 RepID=A0ABT6KUU6_9MYCO|nr:nitroreductase [Mycolicibacterium frederiksbergense]MDH6194026.1 deazaflavin-dependent oxidoreductase (nitroreductase family) [Mycolicibacterium frederiksbergense]